MSCNVYLPHLLVLPEDSANTSIANGFLLTPALLHRKIHVLPSLGGWPKVRDECLRLSPSLSKYPERRLLMLLDFDLEFSTRSEKILNSIDPAIKNKVFLLGSMNEPEVLKKLTGQSIETIGKNLGRSCSENTGDNLWNHPHLIHNASELQRLKVDVSPFLFNIHK